MKINKLFQEIWKNQVAKQILMISTILVVMISLITVTALLGTSSGKGSVISKSSESQNQNGSQTGSVSMSDQSAVSENQSGILSVVSGSKAQDSNVKSSLSSSKNPTVTSSSSRSSNSNNPTQKKEYYQSQVGIWYTVWWQDNKAENPYRSMYSHWSEWTRITPVRGNYSSGDTKIIKEHMGLFHKYGIDYVILDDTNGHGADAGSIASNMNKIFATVKDMGTGNAPKISVALGGAFNDGAAADPYGSRKIEANQIYYNYATAYNNVYFKWKEKPLLVSYGLVKYQSWDDDRFSVRRATGSVNEWIYSGTPVPPAGIWGWVFNNQINNPEVYGVIPGFNKGVLPGSVAGSQIKQIKREQGEHYMDMWLDAISENRETIVISSWNDFAEEPAIEACRPRPDSEIDAVVADAGYPLYDRHERDKLNGTDRHNTWLDYYGDLAPYWYEEITWAYASLKTTLLDGYYYREQGSDKFYKYTGGKLVEQSAKPHGHPIVRIPAGYFDWFLNK